MSDMWPHLLNLLWRIIHGMPLLVSSGWGAWILGLCIFLLYELSVVFRRGWQDMKNRWTENFLMGLGVTAFGYLILFAWSTIQTVYDNHHDSVSRWQAVVNEKNNLKAGLTERDNYITKQEGTSPVTKVVTKAAPPIQPRCWASSHFGMPNSRVQGAVTTTAVILHCNHKVDAPFRVAVEFDRDFIPGATVLNDSGSWNGGGEEKLGKNCISDFTSPSLLSDQIVVMTVYGATDQYPRPVRADIESLH
jgi:hypothetical protein